MIRLWILNIILLFTLPASSQVVIDSCFSSVGFNISENCDPRIYPHSEYITGNSFWLSVWKNNKWNPDSCIDRLKNHFANKQAPLPVSITNAKGLYMGGTFLDSKNEEYFALKLNKPLISGVEYSFTFTYSAIYKNDKYKSSIFSPILLTNKRPSFKKSVEAAKLPPAGYINWETNTITFVATKKQKNHRWIIIDATDSKLSGQGGMILDMCTKIPKKEIVLTQKKDTANIDTTGEIQLKKGTNIVLNNIFFETGKADLFPSSYAELNKLVHALKQNKELIIEIEGHTDNQGQEKENLDLSESRAKVVAEYIIEKGILKERISYQGYGGKKPIDTNDTEEGRSKNRRVEITMAATTTNTMK